MKTRMLYESQGIDNEIDEMAKKMYSVMYRDLRKFGVKYEDQWDYTCMLSCELPRNAGTIRYKVKVKLYTHDTKYDKEKYDENEQTDEDYFDFESPCVTGCCGWNHGYKASVIMAKLDPSNPYEYDPDDDDDALFSVQVCVNICPELDIYSAKFKAEFFETIAHELMHTKSTIRIYAEAGYPTEACDRYVATDSTMADEIWWRPAPSLKFNYTKYLLGPNEMKSYVYSMYDYIKMLTIQGRIHGVGELGKAVASANTSWVRYKQAEDWLNTVDPKSPEFDEFVRKMKTQKGKHGENELKHIEGISTGADLIRVMKKNMKTMKLKLAKAAYKGYCDAIARNKILKSNK